MMLVKTRAIEEIWWRPIDSIELSFTVNPMIFGTKVIWVPMPATQSDCAAAQ